jgi:hypothetical protein
MRMLITFAAGAALVAGGCGGSATSHEPVRKNLNRPCYDKLGEPLKAADLIAAFEIEGFTMYSLPESSYTHCDGAGVDGVAHVTNRRSVTDDEASDREGWVTCKVSRDTVFREPPGAGLDKLYADLDRGPSSPVYGGAKAVFVLANASCTHYPPSEDAGDWTGRAHVAMQRLERRLASGDGR